jgi:hypothetical protein
MSTSHRRLFEASLAALLLADREEEEEPPATAQARDQWYKSTAKRTLPTGPWAPPSVEKAG